MKKVKQYDLSEVMGTQENALVVQERQVAVKNKNNNAVPTQLIPDNKMNNSDVIEANATYVDYYPSEQRRDNNPQPVHITNYYYQGYPTDGNFRNDNYQTPPPIPQQPNQNGMNKEYVPIQNNGQSSLINNQNGINNTKDADTEREFLIRQALVKNPFLFDNRPDNKYVNSIEDFYVTYKKEEYRFGDIVRKKDLRKHKKKKILKECFKEWKEEIEHRIEDDQIISAGQFENNDRVKESTIHIGFGYFFFSALSIILCAILLAAKIEFIGERSKIEILFMNFILPLSLGVILIGGLINKQNSVFNKLNKYVKGQYKKKINAVQKDFNKKYAVTTAYYKKAHTNNFKKLPLPISKTAVGSEKFLEIENIVTQTTQTTISVDKRVGGYKFVRFIIKAITILSIVFVGGDTIYALIAKLIEKLVNK